MKKMDWLWMLVVLVYAAMVGSALAANLRPLTEQERAYFGATHVAEITYADLTSTATNTAETVAFAMPAKAAIEGVVLIVDEAFVGPTNEHYTLGLTIGEPASATRFVSTTELSSVATNAWIKWANTAYNTTQATNVTFAYGQHVYTAATNTGLRFVFTPADSSEPLTAPASSTAGKLRMFFRLFGY